MLVHRDNDDKSDTGRMSGKPRLFSVDPAPEIHDNIDESASDQNQEGDDTGGYDSGKTNLIGDALKSVYQRTLEEDIPDDFLDLLKQLK